MLKLNPQATIDMDSTSAIPKFISHIKERETKEEFVFQSNDEHCMDVAKWECGLKYYPMNLIRLSLGGKMERFLVITYDGKVWISQSQISDLLGP